MAKSNYSAPALEKGLAILQMLAGVQRAMTASEIAAELGRSKAEIYRMLLTLEMLNYINQDESGLGFRLTGRLFELGLKKPSRQHLLDTALRHMEILARETGQSCHLTVVSDDATVVLARAESEADVGYAVRVGYRVSAINGTSGRVLYGFQSPDQKAVWLNWMKHRAERQDLRDFLADAKLAKRQGYLVRDSYYTFGVTDLVVPIISSRYAVAALVVPFIDHIENRLPLEQVRESLVRAADLISSELVPVDQA
jgi:DNA-binding IclR family transcriptional regulator